MNQQLDLAIDTAPRTIRLEDGELVYWPGFLDGDHANHYFNLFKATLAWSQDTLNIAGKQVLIPRLQAWYGEPDAAYQYSGLAMKPLPPTAALLSVAQRVAVASEQCFNSVLANLYRDGNDSVGWHSDDEPELGAAPVIASLSLGATRLFRLKHKRKPYRHDIALRNGDLLIMRGVLQSHWHHQVPKTQTPVTERINLTFRSIVQL